MNPRLRAVDSHKPPFRSPEPMPPKPGVQLVPVAWGKRDPALARWVCRAIVDAAPVTVIRFNPLTHARMQRDLRSLGINC